MSAKQATQEVVASSRKQKPVTINLPDDLGEWYSFDQGDNVIWQATDTFGAFTLQQGSGPNDFFNFPISSATTPPFVAQAVAAKSGRMQCNQQAPRGGNQTSRNLQSGNVIIVDTSTPGPSSARSNQN